MTKFTREDFEHAARAAGLDIWTGGGPHEGGGYPVGMDSDGGYEAIWNPPEDDGDTLRLAAAIEAQVGYSSFSGEGVAHWNRGSNEVRVYGPDDPCAAIRYATFRAAIAIGKAMLAQGTGAPS